MRVLITGATGFIGRALTLRLSAEHEVVAYTRDVTRARALLPADVQICSPDDGDAALERAVLAADAVINLAGASVAQRWTAKQRRAIVDSRVQTTARLVAAIARSAHKPALISASAVGYYGHDTGDQALVESSPSGSGFLADVCRAWEAQACRADAAGARVALMRIGVVLGQGGGALSKMVTPFRFGIGGPLGSGKQFVSWIHIDDVVEAFVAALTDERFRGVYNLTAPTPVSNTEMASGIARAMGTRSRLRTPGALITLALGRASEIVLGGQRAMPQRLLEQSFRFRYREVAAALADLLEHDASGASEISMRSLRPDEAPSVPTPPAPTASRGTRSDLQASAQLQPGGRVPVTEYTAGRAPQYLLSQTTVIDAPLDEVFEFFSDARNLGALTPPEMRFEILTPQPIAMGEGTEIDYRIALGPLPLRWRTLIAEWQPPTDAGGGRRHACFADAQLRGPYRCWWHEHHFHADGERTIMEDRVYYALPFGPLGRVVHALSVARQLREIFVYRSRAIAHRFRGAGGAPADDQRQGSGQPRAASHAA